MYHHHQFIFPFTADHFIELFNGLEIKERSQQMECAWKSDTLASQIYIDDNTKGTQRGIGKTLEILPT